MMTEKAEDRYARYPSLRERVVLVTGGGSGIGESIVEHFVRQGAKVAFLDVDREASEKLVARLSGPAEDAPLFLQCDLTDISALQQAVREVIERLGPVEVLVNNAGRDDRHDWAEVKPEYWDGMMAVNLRHHFFAIQAVAPGMAERGGGSIINLSSISWLIPSTGLPAYVTAKAAIVGLTRTMAHELGAAGIRVNAVLPGGIVTERQRRLWRTPEYAKEIMSNQCIQRDLLPEDVARMVLFLASDDSSGITSQNHVVDGGWV
jgi:NAD(P)-dependent dehydrogenase (short-subunit alcohol dehydrogenase family)